MEEQEIATADTFDWRPISCAIEVAQLGIN